MLLPTCTILKKPLFSSFPQGTCWGAQESPPFLTSLRCTVREGVSYLTIFYPKHTHSGVRPLETSQPWPWKPLDSCYVPGSALDTGAPEMEKSAEVSALMALTV